MTDMFLLARQDTAIERRGSRVHGQAAAGSVSWGRVWAMTTAARASADVGLIGLAVMGQNLALNMADHGYRVVVYNRTTAVMDKFVAGHGDTPGGLAGSAALPDFVAALKKPRKILVLVKAGAPVDAVVEQLLGAGVEPDDIVVDCGNS